MPRIIVLLLTACSTGTVGTAPTKDTAVEADTDSDTDTDTDTDSDADTDTDTDTDTTPAVDYREAGSFSVATSSESMSLSTGCNASYELYEPIGGEGGPVVIFGHGFARGTAQLVGWSEHFASWGLTVAALTSCSYTDHEANGESMAALAAELDSGAGVLYAGHSAGGLSAVVAGASDVDALGVIGFDLTDASDIALGAADSLTVPTYGIVGEANSCNSDGNGVAVYERAGVSVVRVSGADHCDFEDETDWLCTTFCPAGSTDDALAREVIRGLSAAAAVELAGLGAGIDAWWTPGGLYYDSLIDDGTLSVP